MLISDIDDWGISWEIALGFVRWEINIGLGNGLVPSSNKPVPESMLTQIYVAIPRHSASMT